MLLKRVFLLAVSCLSCMPLSYAAELVKFESAVVPLSEFQQKRTQARGEVLQPPHGDEIQAYVVKPPGTGPHPVVIYLHDCGGLASDVTSQEFGAQASSAEISREAFWTKRLLSWRYAVMLVDSYGPRGINDTCDDPKRGNTVARVADAYGALAYIAKQSWADPQRIGLLGFQTGGYWRIPATGDTTAFVVGPERFKAAVAFVYSQTCGLKSQMAAPTLIINGVSLPEKTETCTRLTAQQTQGGAPAEERVAPNLFKNFEPNSAMPDKISFPDWLRSEPQNAEMAAAQVRDFLAQHLKP
jgi:dienelactone hydrolase